MKYHIHMSIKRAQAMADNRHDIPRIKAMFGYTSIADLREVLQSMVDEGMTVIPGEGCDNKLPTGECQGHPSEVLA